MLINADLEFSVRLTLTRKNYKGCAAGVKYLIKKNIKNIIINLDWAFDNLWSDSEIDGVINEYKKIYLYRKSIGGIFIRPLDSWKESISGDHCIAACQFGASKPIVGCDGKIYACTMFNGNRNYEIGSVLDTKKFEHMVFPYTIEQLPECENCIANNICKKNYCACTNFQLTGNIEKKSSVLCNYYHKIGQMLQTLC